MSGSTILGIVASAVILLTLFEMMRRHRLREKYALIWALVARRGHRGGAVPGPALRGHRTPSGSQVPTNLLFFCAAS